MLRLMGRTRLLTIASASIPRASSDLFSFAASVVVVTVVELSVVVVEASVVVVGLRRIKDTAIDGVDDT